MIKMTPKDNNETKHIVIKTNEPACITVTLTDKGHLLVYAYEGDNPDEYQDPIGCYDSFVENEAWEHK